MLIKYGFSYYSVEKLVEMNVTLEMCQYHAFGNYSEWRPIDGQKAIRKASIIIDGYHPYKFRVAE